MIVDGLLEVRIERTHQGWVVRWPDANGAARFACFDTTDRGMRFLHKRVREILTMSEERAKKKLAMGKW